MMHTQPKSSLASQILWQDKSVVLMLCGTYSLSLSFSFSPSLPFSLSLSLSLSLSFSPSFSLSLPLFLSLSFFLFLSLSPSLRALCTGSSTSADTAMAKRGDQYTSRFILVGWHNYYQELMSRPLGGFGWLTSSCYYISIVFQMIVVYIIGYCSQQCHFKC